MPASEVAPVGAGERSCPKTADGSALPEAVVDMRGLEGGLFGAGMIDRLPQRATPGRLGNVIGAQQRAEKERQRTAADRSRARDFMFPPKKLDLTTSRTVKHASTMRLNDRRKSLLCKRFRYGFPATVHKIARLAGTLGIGRYRLYPSCDSMAGNLALVTAVNFQDLVGQWVDKDEFGGIGIRESDRKAGGLEIAATKEIAGDHILRVRTVCKAEEVLGVGIEALQDKGMGGFRCRGAAEDVDDSFARARVEIFDSIPVDTVGPWRDVEKIGVPDERAKFFFVEAEFFFCGGVLFGRPGRCVLHDGEPAHHAAAQHVTKIFYAWGWPAFDVGFQHRGGQDVTRIIEGAAIGEWVIRIRN